MILTLIHWMELQAWSTCLLYIRWVVVIGYGVGCWCGRARKDEVHEFLLQVSSSDNESNDMALLWLMYTVSLYKIFPLSTQDSFDSCTLYPDTRYLHCHYRIPSLGQWSFHSTFSLEGLYHGKRQWCVIASAFHVLMYRLIAYVSTTRANFGLRDIGNPSPSCSRGRKIMWHTSLLCACRIGSCTYSAYSAASANL